MSDPRQLDLRRLKLAGRAPRLALFAACGLLAAASGARLAAGPSPAGVPVAARSSERPTTDEEGLAERFATAYLTLVPGDEDERARRLTALGLADSAGPVDRAGRVERRVVHTSVAAVDREPNNIVRVTVAVDDGRSWTYLAVPVRRVTGRLSVAGAPAMVGPPAVARDALTAPEDEVQDAALKQVVQRVVRHYLAGDRSDLAADLVPGATPSPPATRWQTTSIDATTWARRPRRVAVLLEARSPDGLRLTLRYELAVVRRGGRWLVAAVFTDPKQQEQSR